MSCRPGEAGARSDPTPDPTPEPLEISEHAQKAESERFPEVAVATVAASTGLGKRPDRVSSCGHLGLGRGTREKSWTSDVILLLPCVLGGPPHGAAVAAQTQAQGCCHPRLGAQAAGGQASPAVVREPRPSTPVGQGWGAWGDLEQSCLHCMDGSRHHGASPLLPSSMVLLGGGPRGTMGGEDLGGVPF